MDVFKGDRLVSQYFLSSNSMNGIGSIPPHPLIVKESLRAELNREREQRAMRKVSVVELGFKN